MKTEFDKYTDAQLDEIYYVNVGYRPIAEDGATRETVIDLLKSYKDDHNTTLSIPQNIDSIV